MACVEMDEEVIKPKLTEEAKNKNYLQLIGNLKYLQNGYRITEDWLEHNRAVALKYRDWFYDFSTINPDIKDAEFRKKAAEAETLLSNICAGLHANDYLDVKYYRMLLERMVFLCDFLVPREEREDAMDKLADFMAQLGV
jgi:hypothetical protein